MVVAKNSLGASSLLSCVETSLPRLAHISSRGAGIKGMNAESAGSHAMLASLCLFGRSFSRLKVRRRPGGGRSHPAATQRELLRAMVRCCMVDVLFRYS